jgi:hypothetical protein
VAVSLAGESSADPEQDSNSDAPYAGAVYVYDRRLGTPLQYVKAPTPRAREFFGESMALSGSWLAVGAPGNDEGATDSGAVYLYKLSDRGVENGVFAPAAQVIKALTPTPNSLLGRAVALDGDWLVAGAPAATGPGGELGAGKVLVYRRFGDAWQHVVELNSPFPTYAGFFGYAVSMSGNRFAVGAVGATACNADEKPRPRWHGAVYVVTLNGDDWSVGPCLTSRKGGAPLGFGGSVALLGDQLAIAAPWDSNGLPDEPPQSRPLSGAVYLYEYSSAEGFHETKYIKAPNQHALDLFGFPVALRPGLLLVGAAGQSGSQASVSARPEAAPATAAGAAYLFSLSEGAASETR